MEYTKEEFNKVTIQTLKSRGDHISLNAVKMIEEMQEQAINYTRCCETLGTKCEQPMHLHNFNGCANCGGD